MTYCVALRLDSGMIFASDSRTNAGVDQVATFCKTRVYERPDDRVIVVLSSGNLGMTQGVTNILDRHIHVLPKEDKQTIWNVPSMFDVATLVGDALRAMVKRDGHALNAGGVDSSSNLIVGGQIRGEGQRLFHIYPQGNFIEASDETPYFQLGEAKYGKPILDRVLTTSTPQKEAAKCVLISFDSTIRSNISVGLPIDMLWYPRDSLRVGVQQRIREGDPYFSMVRQRWGGGLRRVFSELPDPDWME
ncbi:MAG: peptidase [Aeromicrobium sp.]|nr:peptidase [Burkholderiales bacterium]